MPAPAARPRHHAVDRSFAWQILRSRDAAIAGPEVSCLAIVLESVPVEQHEDHEACLEELIAVWLALGANEAELLIERRNLGDISHAKGDQANKS